MCVICELDKMGISEDHLLAANGMNSILHESPPVMLWLSHRAGAGYSEEQLFRTQMRLVAYSDAEHYARFRHITGINREVAECFYQYTRDNYGEVLEKLLTVVLTYATLYQQHCDPVSMLETAIEVAEARAAGHAGMMNN